MHYKNALPGRKTVGSQLPLLQHELYLRCFGAMMVGTTAPKDLRDLWKS